MTLAEIRFGIEHVADANRRAELTDWFSMKVRPMFEQRVLPITEDIMSKSGELRQYLDIEVLRQRTGRNLAVRFPADRPTRSDSYDAI